MTRAEIFRQCAREVDKRGLALGAYLTLDGCVCSVGAISLVVEGRAGLCPTKKVERYALFVAKTLGLGDMGDLFEWNDRPSRTKAQVVAAFRKAARLAARKRVSK